MAHYRYLSTIKSLVLNWLSEQLIDNKTAVLLTEKVTRIQNQQSTKASILIRLSKVIIGIGVSLILAGILYFFASNWSGMGRFEKVGLVVGLMGIVCVLSIVLKQEIYKNIARFSCVFIFGIALGLVGQIYNTKADSYVLFLLWSVPALLCSVLCSFKPFYSLGFCLVNLTLGLFIEQRGDDVWDSFWVYVFMGFNIGIAMMLTVLEAKNIRKSSIVNSLGWTLGMGVLLVRSIYFENESFLRSMGLNVLFMVMIIGGLWIVLRVYKDRGLAYSSTFLLITFLCVKYIEISNAYYDSILVNVILLMVGGCMVAVNYLIVQWVSRELKR